ncbi:hypothetical protein C8R43DRAFT_943613 [Mycena crocata]|nr:hypothetical protein C8R43DRAFT_943608 [Mycena crocata]KAJ7173979.1 hypothetical protein C8R43DRAFT_943613 [Mycena crocata]
MRHLRVCCAALPLLLPKVRSYCLCTPQPTPRRLRRTGIGSLCAIPQLSTYRSPDLAIQNLPERRLEYPWELFSSSSSEQTVSDWVLPPRFRCISTLTLCLFYELQLPQSLQKIETPSKPLVLTDLELSDLTRPAKTSPNSSGYIAGFRLDLAAIHPNPEILRAEGRDYLQIENGSLMAQTMLKVYEGLWFMISCAVNAVTVAFVQGHRSDVGIIIVRNMYTSSGHQRRSHARTPLGFDPSRSFMSSPTLSYSASKPLPGWDTYLSSSLTTLRLEYFMSGFIDAYLQPCPQPPPSHSELYVNGFEAEDAPELTQPSSSGTSIQHVVVTLKGPLR